jgi:hypothetical protein
LPDGIPSWASFLQQIDSLEACILSENLTLLSIIAERTDQAATTMQDAINRLSDLESSIRVL